MADYSTKAGMIRAIIAECIAQGLGLIEQLAYVLATVQHETNGTYMPVREAYWLSEAWRKRHLRYWPFYGRGLVQITWQRNYEFYGRVLGIDLADNPDLALQAKHAIFILVHGFKHGTFTGRKLEDYVRADHVDYTGARRCINGTDKARTIAGYARDWERRLNTVYA